MSLAAVYDALRAANVDEAKATAAMEALEASRDEPRLRRIEERIGELRADIQLLRWICAFNMALGITTLAIVIRLAFQN